MQTPEHFTLKQVADSIRKVIAERYARTYWVTAEMHKLNYTKKGHCYPELVQKEDGQILVEMRGTIWKQQFDRIQQRFAEIVKEPLRDGMELLFQVKITYHPLYNIGLEIIDIDPNYTLGALQKERQITLERLVKEGILNNNQQLKMALLPKRLAIISQADSKGYSDFIVLLNGHPKRYRFDTFLFDATLQGDAAIFSIQTQLSRIEKVKHLFDAVVIIRGGGGEIGMHCYNNYELSKQIATFPLPVLTGIGHSTNLTVCEMVAFRHGITPSDIAYFLISIMEELDAPLDEFLYKLPAITERFLQDNNNILERNVRLFHQDVKLAVAEKRAIFQQRVHLLELLLAEKNSKRTNELLQVRKELRSIAIQVFEKQKQRQEHAVTLFGLATKNRLSEATTEIKSTQLTLLKNRTQFIDKQREQLLQIDKTVQLVHPMNVLKRGYAIVTNQSGVISTLNNPTENSAITITTAFGELAAVITKKTKPL